jgi:hypothetical protein
MMLALNSLQDSKMFPKSITNYVITVGVEVIK